jgi:hypothetical protein
VQFEPNGNYAAAFETLGNTPVLPGLFELGPASTSLRRLGLNSSLNLSGTVFGLKGSDGQFLVQEPIQFTVRTGPFTNTISTLPDPLLDLGFATLSPGTKSRLRLHRDSSGVFSVGLNDLDLDLLGRTASKLDVESSTDGSFLFRFDPSSTTFLLGPFQWRANASSFLTWNAQNGTVSASLGGGSLRSATITGWPSLGISMPTISLNSQGDFDYTMVLPAFSFNGISLGGDPEQELNYLRLRSQNGVVTAEIHDEKTFFGSTMELDLSISSDGTVTGSFTGDFSADFSDIGLGVVPFADVALQYDPAQPSYQFGGEISSELFPDLTFRAYFGSGGQLICLGNFCL